MPDNVSRLKQLLFDNEAEALADLSRKLDLLQQDRVEANRRFDAVFKRAGTDERLQKSIAAVLDGAFREAEVSNHDALAQSVAPVVVNTIKAEIRNSRDDLAEALYPMTGRMVKAYIASAIKELTEKLNRSLESNSFMRRLGGRSGSDAGNMLLAEAQKVDVDELFLIRRGTGELLARWPANDTGHNQDQVMSGVLTAINDFASEALKDEGSSLRQIDLGNRQVYLRASPAFLLAAKCTGSGSAAVEGVLDDAFLSAIEQIHTLQDRQQLDNSPETKTKLLSLLASDLQEDIEEAQSVVDDGEPKPTRGPLKTLAWVIGLPLALWMCWLVYANYWRARVEDVAQQIVISSSELRGYPTELNISALGRDVRVSGLAPTRYAKRSLVNRLKLALPGTTVNADLLSVVPSGDQAIDQVMALRDDLNKFRPDIATLRADFSTLDVRIALATMRSDLTRAQRSLQIIMTELPRIEDDASSGNERAMVARLKETVGQASQDLVSYNKQANAPEVGWRGVQRLSKDLSRLNSDLQQRAQEMSTLLINPDQIGKPVRIAVADPDNAGVQAQALAADSDHLARVTVAVGQIVALKNRLPKPPPVPKPYAPSALQNLEEFARRHAVFFSTGVSYRAPKNVSKMLDDLATHINKTDAVVRVVGYTDEQGSSDQNTPLSQQRADKVADALVRRGVSRERLIALGRKDFRDITDKTGSRSANRRVEFELGFANEISR